MVFQHFHLFPHLTIQKNITLAPVKLKRMTQQEADEKAAQLLEKVWAFGQGTAVSEPTFRRSETTYCHCPCAGNAA